MNLALRPDAGDSPSLGDGQDLGADQRGDPSQAAQRELESQLRELTCRLDEVEQLCAQQAAMLENLQDIVLTVAADGSITAASGNVVGLLGRTEASLLALDPPDRLGAILHPQDSDGVQQLLSHVPSAYRPLTGRFRIVDAAGEALWVDASFVPLRDERGDCVGAQIVAADISRQMQSEAMVGSLNAAARTLQNTRLSPSQVLQAAADELSLRGFYAVIGLVSPESNSVTIERFGGDSAVLASVGRLVAGLAKRYDVPVGQMPSPIEGVLVDREPRCFLLEERHLRAMLPKPVRASASLVLRLLPTLNTILVPLVAHDQVLGVLAVGGRSAGSELVPSVSAFANHLAVAYRNAELLSELQASEKQYRGIFEATQDGMLFVEPEGQVVSVNSAACRLLGIESSSVKGVSIARLLSRFGQGIDDDLIAVLQAEGRYGATWRSGTKDAAVERVLQVRGTEMLYRGRPHWLILVADVTEQTKAQEALVSAERLRALGQMAGGIAHDFNNILVGVKGFADAALEELPGELPRVRGDLERIVAGADDAAEAVRRLQSLYRSSDDTSDFARLCLDDLMRDAVELTRPHWRDQAQARGTSIEVETQLQGPLYVQGNASELRRVFTNLLVNAVEAMPQGGRITVRSGSDAEGCSVSVCDTGLGMSVRDRARIFEPFFSTKRSSGLGLAVSRRTVERHGGTISVESELGVGSQFTVWLPVAAGAEPCLPEQTPEPDRVSEQLSVLVVDDEDTVRALLRRFLERAGHSVDEAESGHDAIELLATRDYHLMVTDLGMPSMSGSELAVKAHELCPELCIILATGWGSTVSPVQVREMGVQSLLSKPFSHSSLSIAIAEAFGNHPPD